MGALLRSGAGHVGRLKSMGYGRTLSHACLAAPLQGVGGVSGAALSGAGAGGTGAGATAPSVAFWFLPLVGPARNDAAGCLRKPMLYLVSFPSRISLRG